MKMNCSDRGSCRGGAASECRRRALCRLAVLLVCAALAQTGFSRAYKFRLLRATADSARTGGVLSDDTARRDSYQVELSASAKSDSLADMEIRAATILKQANNKGSVINDIATYRFSPTGRRQQFVVECGAAANSRPRTAVGTIARGYVKGGVIIEVWQNGSCLKHWSSTTGPLSKTKLTSDVKCAYIDATGYNTSVAAFKNATTITELREDGEEAPEAAKEYYIVKDARIVTDADREYVFLHMGTGSAEDLNSSSRLRIFTRRLTKAQLDDLKSVYANCRAFATKDELKEFIRKGPELPANAQNPLGYAIRDAEKVTDVDRRLVFEEMPANVASFTSPNVIIRRFSEQDLADFKMINPKSKVFRSLEELKAFMRTVKITETKGEVTIRRVEAPQDAAVPAAGGATTVPVTGGATTVPATGGATTTPAGGSTTTPATAAPKRPQLTMEELEARIKAEMAHEKEMIMRQTQRPQTPPQNP